MQVQDRRDPRPHRGQVLPVLGVEAVALLHLHHGQRQRHGVQRRADVVGQGGDHVVHPPPSVLHLRIPGGGVGEDRLLHRPEEDRVDGAGLGVPRPGPEHLGGEGPDRLLEQGVLPQQRGQADPLPLAGGGVRPGLGHHRGRRLPSEPPDQPVEQEGEVAGQVGVGEPLGLGGLPADGQHPEPEHVVAVGDQDVGQGHLGSSLVGGCRPRLGVQHDVTAPGPRPGSYSIVGPGGMGRSVSRPARRPQLYSSLPSSRVRAGPRSLSPVTTRRIIASSLVKSIGLVMWAVNPASRLRLMSSSMP